MRLKLYYFLVNRQSGIRSRYHRLHDNGTLFQRLLSYPYLLWLNFCYYVLGRRFLGQAQAALYEEKRLPERAESETRRLEGPGAEELARRLSGYDIVSFDIFDTLLLRPFSEPSDLFHFLGLRLGLMDLKALRVGQEAEVRGRRFGRSGQHEVTLEDIWEGMERETGIAAERGMCLEQELERTFCYANPYMLQVFQRLKEAGKRLIAISDMYLSSAFLKELLAQNGYDGLESVYVSCEHGCGKGDGGLFRKVSGEMPKGARLAHVGDNAYSDVKMARKNGFYSFYYPNVNRYAAAFRPFDMSPVIGGAYRGIVNNRLYTGLRAYSPEYEYGYVLGGLFAVGYCSFIHAYCRNNQVQRLLFLSRDGDILKQVYDRLFPGENTVYVYWSRMAAVKLMAEYDRHDFFRRFLTHRTGEGISLGQALEDMELGDLAKELESYVDRDVWGEETGICLSPSQKLTGGNLEAVKRFLLGRFEKIKAVYRPQSAAAKKYYEAALSGVSHGAAIDIGWAGSGALSLAYLTERVWKLPCRITGIVAGTNTVHNGEPEASEIFLQSGRLVSYLFSQAFNRDVMKKHDPNKDHNLFWELLLSSPTRQFLGFGLDRGGEVLLRFGGYDDNLEGMKQIQLGILDFAQDYAAHFKEFPFMLDISGRDAAAPMLLASGCGEKYLRFLAKRFHQNAGICERKR